MNGISFCYEQEDFLKNIQKGVLLIPPLKKLSKLEHDLTDSVKAGKDFFLKSTIQHFYKGYTI